jgi:hypothetical protein
MTGVSIEVRQRIQFNIQVQPWPAMTTFQNAPNVMMPILWAEEVCACATFFRIEIGSVWVFFFEFCFSLKGWRH